MDNAREWMVEYKKRNGIENPAFSGKFSTFTPASDLITSMRDIFDLPEDWFIHCDGSKGTFRTLRAKFESVGILVMQNGVVGSNNRRKLDVNEFRAFCLADTSAPLIFINTNDSDSGKVFSLAHEGAHAWIGENDFYNDEEQNSSGSLETLCNKVASEILVPAAILSQEWYLKGGELTDKIAALLKVFHCSARVILRKAFEISLISRQQFVLYDRMFVDQAKQGVKRRGGNYYSTLKTRWSSQFILALGKSAHAGNTLYRDVYKMTGMTGKTFSRLVRELGDG